MVLQTLDLLGLSTLEHPQSSWKPVTPYVILPNLSVFPKQNIPKSVTTCKWSLNTGFSPAPLLA
jgi:hypothetical protein